MDSWIYVKIYRNKLNVHIKDILLLFFNHFKWYLSKVKIAAIDIKVKYDNTSTGEEFGVCKYCWHFFAHESLYASLTWQSPHISQSGLSYHSRPIPTLSKLDILHFSPKRTIPHFENMPWPLVHVTPPTHI